MLKTIKSDIRKCFVLIWNHVTTKQIYKKIVIKRIKMHLIDKKIFFVGFYLIKFKNSCSEIIGIASEVAFSRLLGPILSPATT